MQTHELQRTHPHKGEKRVGRGDRRGKTSGRGHKGQKSRAGHRLRPQLRDTLKKLPKRRGYGVHRADSVHSGRVKPTVVNVGTISTAFDAGATVTPATLAEKKLITRRGGKLPTVKVLASGAIDTKVTVRGCEVSDAAQKAIEAAGGSVEHA